MRREQCGAGADCYSCDIMCIESKDRHPEYVQKHRGYFKTPATEKIGQSATRPTHKEIIAKFKREGLIK